MRLDKTRRKGKSMLAMEKKLEAKAPKKKTIARNGDPREELLLTAASRLLGMRNETLREIVDKGKIAYRIEDGRIYITRRAIELYRRENSKVFIPESMREGMRGIYEDLGK